MKNNLTIKNLTSQLTKLKQRYLTKKKDFVKLVQQNLSLINIQIKDTQNKIDNFAKNTDTVVSEHAILKYLERDKMNYDEEILEKLVKSRFFENKDKVIGWSYDKPTNVANIYIDRGGWLFRHSLYDIGCLSQNEKNYIREYDNRFYTRDILFTNPKYIINRGYNRYRLLYEATNEIFVFSTYSNKFIILDNGNYKFDYTYDNFNLIDEL